MEDQQPVAATGDTRAGNQMDIVLGRFPTPLGGRVDWNRPTGGIGREIAVQRVGRPWSRNTVGLGIRRNVWLAVVGSRPRQLSA